MIVLGAGIVGASTALHLQRRGRQVSLIDRREPGREASSGNATLSRPVLDAAVGYVLAPMERGIRLTTGIEFAAPDAPPTPVQLDHAEPYARELLPLDDRVDAEPWMGRRPCFPDSLPMIGPASKHGNLWLNFGHAHVGLATGPVSGRLLAELVTGEPMVADPASFSPARF